MEKPKDLDYKKIYENIKNIIIEAGKIIKESTENREVIIKTVEIKENNRTNMVTLIDKKVESLLKSEFKKLYPDFNFIGEESTKEGQKITLTEDPTWVIDPIDGTTNFVHGVPFCCISVGLLVNKEPVLGIIYNPILNEFYHGIKNNGAFMNDMKLPLALTTPLKDIDDAMIISEFGYTRDKENVKKKLDTITKLLDEKIHAIRSLGSCALDMCLIAKGNCDIYYEVGIHIWDMCAGYIIVKESGGQIIQWKKPDTSTENDDILNESFDLLGRHLICIRNIPEGNDKQRDILKKLRELITYIDEKSD